MLYEVITSFFIEIFGAGKFSHHINNIYDRLVMDRQVLVDHGRGNRFPEIVPEIHACDELFMLIATHIYLQQILGLKRFLLVDIKTILHLTN